MTMSGMPTLLHVRSLDDNVALAQELQLGFIELNMGLPQFSSGNLRALQLEKVAARTGLRFTVHLPEEVDFGYFNDESWEGSVKMVETILRSHTGDTIKLLNLHINRGTYFSLPNERVYLYQTWEDEYRARVARAVDALGPLLKQSGIALCFENTGNFGDPRIQSLVSSLVEREQIGVTWDFGHDAASGFAEKDYLLGLGARVRHCHLHDFHGKDHQELYTGCVDVHESLGHARSLGIDVVIETKDVLSLRNSVRKLRERDEL